tara:strand:+ start:24 stop:503 length:480 start_codon:yes stop_codon:yes gene_type:complete
LKWIGQHIVDLIARFRSDVTIDGNLTVSNNTLVASTGRLRLTPAVGSDILLDGTISVDAGVVTGASSITSTAFVGNISGSSGSCTGQAATVATIAGLAPNTATTAAIQGSITRVGTLSTLTVNSAENTVITFSALPTSDPGAVGQLWNDSNTLKVSTGE